MARNFIIFLCVLKLLMGNPATNERVQSSGVTSMASFQTSITKIETSLLFSPVRQIHRGCIVLRTVIGFICSQFPKNRRHYFQSRNGCFISFYQQKLPMQCMAARRTCKTVFFKDAQTIKSYNNNKKKI